MEKEKKRRGGLYTSDCDDLAIDSDSAHHEALQHLQFSSRRRSSFPHQ